MKIEKREKFVQINKIQGYEDVKDYYYLSNSDEDKIINRNTGKRLKGGFDKDSYKRINLRTKDNKYKACGIHTLKVKAFLYTSNPLAYNIIRHLNDVKTDNRLENLAWGTQSDNVRDSVRNGNFNYEASAKNLAKCRANSSHVKGGTTSAKKTSKPVRCIETGIIYISACEAERRMGIPNNNINCCCNGKRKTAGGFHFEYVN